MGPEEESEIISIQIVVPQVGYSHRELHKDETEICPFCKEPLNKEKSTGCNYWFCRQSY